MCCAPAGASAATAARTATAVPAGSAAATGGAQLVQSAGASQTGAAKSLTAAFPAPTGAGNLLVLSASVYTGTSNRITSVTDSAGGAWTRIGAYAISGHNASGAKWQLITTYNEWGEGTAIESSTGCRNPAPAGTYCDWSGGGTGSDFVADLHSAPPG